MKRWLKRDGVYSEIHAEERSDGKGGTRVKYVDPHTLGVPVPSEPLSRLGGSSERVTESSEVHATPVLAETANHSAAKNYESKLGGPEILTPSEGLAGSGAGLDLALPVPTLTLTPLDLKPAEDLHATLLPILNIEPNTAARRAAMAEVAAAKKASERTVRRWVKAFEELGLVGLAKALGYEPRSDKGTHRLPFELVQVIQSTLVSNTKDTAVRKIHRIVVNAVPELAMVPRKNGLLIEVSVPTVQRIKDEMLADNTLRPLFFDANQRKEYMRAYSGQVLAAHANDMWQMDMTRCDIMVYDPHTDSIYRPRVQAVIDVYSGCIMGLSFSRKENQDQADLVLAHALMTKQGPLAEIWPMRGVARRLYIDNGKTYKSSHFHSIVSNVGMEIIHSKPRVSHTRGKIECWFGTLHTVERALRGYCGENASQRSNLELKCLMDNTLAWAREGKNVDPRDRLLTLGEYQEIVLKWLVTDYHQTVVHGKTRLQHWLDTAPASTRVEFDPVELMLAFATWDDRTVRKDGTVMLDKAAWTTSNGKLVTYQGQVVKVLTEPFALGNPTRYVAQKDRVGRLSIIGELTLAPTIADSLEAAAQRKANERALREQQDEARDIGKEMFNAATVYENHLSEQLQETVVIQPALPAARAQLAAVNPPAAPTLADLGEFGDFLKPADDLDALLRQIKEDSE